MTATFQPFGFRPTNDPSWRGRISNYQGAVASAFATNIYEGTPLKMLADGTLDVVDDVSDKIFAIFSGVRYVDATGRAQINNRWVGGTVATEISFDLYAVNDAGCVFEVQANGPVPLSAQYDQVNTVNPDAGSILFGRSTAAVNATTVGTGVQGQWRIVDFSRQPGNMAGDAYTIIKVQIANSPVVAPVPAV